MALSGPSSGPSGGPAESLVRPAAQVLRIALQYPSFQAQPVKHAPPASRGSYAFGRFHLSVDGTLLVRDGVRIALAPKVLRTLLVLVERAGQVVTKADLLQLVWPDSFVEETGLTRNVSLLRQALDDEAQALIVT